VPGLARAKRVRSIDGVRRAAAPAPTTSAPRARWARSTSALAFAGLVGCASAATNNPGNLTPDQHARVTRVCETVLRVHPGEQHYDGCVESLSDTLGTVGRAQSAQSPRGSPAGASSTSYFYASVDEIHRREQLSCARLGFDPAAGAFASCVAGLAGTLAAIDMPLN
jgi:hypothetical protein